MYSILCLSADMEDLSRGVEICQLYDNKPVWNLPMYIRAFGQYALVKAAQPTPVDHPPSGPLRPTPVCSTPFCNHSASVGFVASVCIQVLLPAIFLS